MEQGASPPDDFHMRTSSSAAALDTLLPARIPVHSDGIDTRKNQRNVRLRSTNSC